MPYSLEAVACLHLHPPPSPPSICALIPQRFRVSAIPVCSCFDRSGQSALEVNYKVSLAAAFSWGPLFWTCNCSERAVLRVPRGRPAGFPCDRTSPDCRRARAWLRSCVGGSGSRERTCVWSWWSRRACGWAQTWALISIRGWDSLACWLPMA